MAKVAHIVKAAHSKSLASGVLIQSCVIAFIQYVVQHAFNIVVILLQLKHFNFPSWYYLRPFESVRNYNSDDCGIVACDMKIFLDLLLLFSSLSAECTITGVAAYRND